MRLRSSHGASNESFYAQTGVSASRRGNRPSAQPLRERGGGPGQSVAFGHALTTPRDG